MENLKLKIDLAKEFASIIMDNDVNHYNLLQSAVEYSKGQGSEEWQILETLCDKFNIKYNSLEFDEIEFLYKEMDKAINAILYYNDF